MIAAVDLRGHRDRLVVANRLMSPSTRLRAEGPPQLRMAVKGDVMPDGTPAVALGDTPSTGRFTSTAALATKTPVVWLAFGGLALLFAWQIILVGLTSTYAEHAARAGARAAAAHGYRRPKARVEVQRRVLARVHGHWADKGHFHLIVDHRHVEVTVDVPAVLPGLHTSWEVRAKETIRHEHRTTRP